MSKVQILLPKDLLIHLSKDEKVELKAGINEVDSELAEHWYVAAHSQPITASDLESDGLKKQLEDVQAELATATTQLDEAEGKITALQSDLKDKDVELLVTQKNLGENQAQLTTTKEQLQEANKTITTLQADAKKKDTELAGLKKQLEASSKEK